MIRLKKWHPIRRGQPRQKRHLPGQPRRLRKDFYTYIRLRPGADPAVLSSRLPAFIQRHIPAESGRQQESRLSLEPLSAIHSTPGLQDEPEPTIR